MRNDDLVTFRWYRHFDDVKWVKARPAPQPFKQQGFRREQWWLVVNPDSYEGAEWYQPLRDELALFRSFAAVPYTELEGMEAFVRAHGPLGIAKFLEPVGSPTPPEGEAFADWTREIQHMRAALDAWDALRDRRPERLAERFRVRRDGAGGIASVFFESPGLSAFVLSEGHYTQLWKYVRNAPENEALKLAALFFVQDAINKRLDEHASPRLLYAPPRVALELCLIPDNLLGAMWLQFGQAVDGNKDYARCAVCRRWFERSPRAKRPEAKHCSTTCRMKAYRDRQEKARRRAAAGESVKAIAADIGSDVETIRRWLRKAGIEETQEK